MALPATSPMVVDLSGDNDSAGALAAAASIPTVSPDAAFERSCDNPECSAPKLISLVPKKETSEFITEPVIMNQPTLINGFTTVFQIDGTGAKMNDIMYGDHSDAGTSNGATTAPRSVFRIVPNTHAHIVNYVVVDGAGETMRKIKANDADTMRKLLDSQRLSAEQMLKKLIEKAFSKPSVPKQVEQPVPLPISYQGQTPKPVSIALPNVLPVSGFKLAAGTVVKPVLTASQEKVLPPVPSGITITQISTVPAVVPAKTSHMPTNIDTSKVLSPTTPNVSAPVLRNALTSPQLEIDNDLGRPTALKRKLTTTAQPDVIKKLRSRSPKHKTPLAVGPQLPLSASVPVIKLPTITKLPTKTSTTASPLVQSSPLPKKSTEDSCTIRSPVTSNLNKNKAADKNEDSIQAPDVCSTALVNKAADSVSISTGTKRGVSTQSSLTASASLKERLSVTNPKAGESILLECHETMQTKPKPLMGPASKMNALKALNTAKASAAQLSKASITKIGETVITSSPAGTPRSDTKGFPNIKPCTVSIPKVDVPGRIKIIDFIHKVNASKIDAAASPKPNITKLTPGATTKTDAKLSSAETLQPVSDTPVVEEDPLFIGEPISSPKANVAPVPKADTKPMTRASLPTKTMLSKAIELNLKATKNSPKHPALTTVSHKSDAALLTKLNPPATSSQAEVMHLKMTRGSTPKVAGPLPTKPAGPLPTKPAGPLPTKPAGQLPIKQSGPLPTKLTVKLPTRPAAVLPTRLSAQANKSATSGDTSATSSLQSKITKVGLATRKSGVMTIPITSPHPNLKISSVISGGSAVAATLGDNSNSSDIIVNENDGGPNIEKLQQELADLRRTVARLTKKKP